MVGRYAERAPDKLSRLVLLDPALGGGRIVPFDPPEPWWTNTREDFVRRVAPEFSEPDGHAAFAEHVVRQDPRSPNGIRAENGRGSVALNPAAITVPTLMIYGSAAGRQNYMQGLSQYADALAETIEAGGETRVGLLGYHTGALVALQIAADRPDLVRRLVLIGIPYFPGSEEREAWRARLAEVMRLTERLDQFDERWNYLVTGRAPGASLEQGFAHFVDELRAWPYGFWAHEAAFTFEPEACVARVCQPTLVLNPATPLAEPSRRAAARLARAEMVELYHMQHGMLDVAAAELARHIHPFTAAS